MKSLTPILPKLCLVTMSLWGLGCSDKYRYENYRWSRNQATPPVSSSLESRFFGRAFSQFDLGSEQGRSDLIFVTQKIQGVDVDGSYYKELRNSETIFKSYRWLVDVPWSLRLKIFWEQLKTPLVRFQFMQQQEFKNLPLFQEPRLVLKDQELLWKFSFLTPRGEIYGIDWSSERGVLSKGFWGSGAQTAVGSLFPEGPLRSQIQKVLLPELQGLQALSTPKVRVFTQSSRPVFSEGSEFVYDLDDDRFQQVQVFYYLSRLLQWTENNLGFQIPFPVEAETQIGFPERTNTAFYYQRRIRLGEGDGVVFSKMSLDPSIVTHEGFHSVIDAVARLPFQGEGGSLNEGLADFLTAILLGNPRLGEFSYKKGPFKRSIANNLSRRDMKGTLYGDSGVISGLLWELAQKLGPDLGLSLGWETLLRLNPTSRFSDFELELREVISQIPDETNRLKAQQIFSNRGWSL
jgi:hypothetical protein